MKKKGFWGLLWILIAAVTLQGQSRESLLKSLQEKSQWLPADQPVSYDEKTIASFAGKRAPTLLRYGFTGVSVQGWKGPQGTARLTLYEMFDPSAAYGLFTLDRNINEAGFATMPIGTEGFRAGNRTEFWQSKYVVKVEGPAMVAEDLARQLSANIFGRSRKPPVSTHLPPSNVIEGSDRYIVDASGITRDLSVDPQVLGFEDSVEVATASYRINGRTAQLLLLMYPTQQIAKKYEDQWASMPQEDASLRKRVGALLALVRNSKDPAVAKAIFDGINYETQVTWDQPRPDISLPDLILTIFTGIGIALLFTVVVGLSFGGVRVFVKAKYPDRVFDRPEDMEIIQLKLGQGLTQKQLRE
jgi:hypothetical protein